MEFFGQLGHAEIAMLLSVGSTWPNQHGTRVCYVFSEVPHPLCRDATL